MKAVILAAGHGSRLVSHNARHKALLPIGGRAVIDYTIDAFAQAGVTDLVVVVGHQEDVVRESVGSGSRHGVTIRYVFNPDYHRGNALSVSAARAFVDDGPFLLAMADHMISRDIVQRLLEDVDDSSALAVDFTPAPRHVEEGTRVQVDDQGLITAIGKALSRWDGIDSGVFRFTPRIFDAIDDLTAGQDELSQAVTRMIQQGHSVRAYDISGCFWQDIDTWEDLTFAREAIAVRGT